MIIRRVTELREQVRVVQLGMVASTTWPGMNSLTPPRLVVKLDRLPVMPPWVTCVGGLTVTAKMTVMARVSLLPLS